MIGAGEQMRWAGERIMDKHSVGGLPGNRTTMIVVPVVAACGLTIPKTSSRAITSPAGTADTMEVLAPVDHDIASMRRIVDRCGGCIVWGGGAMRLSPADDILIRVERPLDLDSEGQLVASVLSKKAAAGSTHVVIDIPVGPTAKVRSDAAAAALARRLVSVSHSLGIEVRIVFSDGLQPVGRGIGPSLEARDVLAVLQGTPDAPPDLLQKSVRLAGEMLEMGHAALPGEGMATARAALEDGRAWRRFQEICAAQGGLRERPIAPFQSPVLAATSGTVLAIDNRRLARAAKLAGAPSNAAAGLDLHVRLGDRIDLGQPLFTLHAGARGELEYAMQYVAARPRIVQAG
jgi:thymidine phosphorylase